MNDYFMDHPREAERLEEKTDFQFLERQIDRLDLAPGGSAVDVGCGTGVVARELRRRTAHVAGIDASESRLIQAAANAESPIDWRRGSAGSLPSATNEFDVSVSRFLFEYLEDPEQAMKEMIRATRPGGRVCVIDLDAQIESLWPQDDHFESELRDALATLRGVGFDTRIGRKLYTMAIDLGLEDVRCYVEPYQVFSGGVPPQQESNWESKIRTTVEWLSAETGDHDRWSRFGDRCREILASPRMFYAVNCVQVVGVAPD